jgi:hypothetical protein
LRHRGLPALGQQSLVKIVERPSSGAGSHGRTLKMSFRSWLWSLLRPRSVTGFLERCSCSSTRYCALSFVSNPRPL